MIRDFFWSHDYATGVESLITALKISVAENQQFLALVKERSRIEHVMAGELAQLSQDRSIAPVKDTSGMKASSIRFALASFTSETVAEAVLHTRIAADLESHVRKPLSKWCDMYAKRIQDNSTNLRALVSQYARLLQAATKLRSTYYDHCRRVEDSTFGNSPKDPIIKTIRLIRERLTTSESLAASFHTDEPFTEAPAAPSTPNNNNTNTNPRKKKPKKFRLAGLEFTKRELASLLQALLANVTLVEYKVPLFGSYKNVCTGSVLASAARKHLRNDSFAYTEKFGQSLVDLGFLKPVGQISNRFQSTHNSHYQWQQPALDLIGGDGLSSDSSEGRTTRESSVASVITSDSAATANSATAAVSISNSATTTSSSAVASNANVHGAPDSSEEDYLQAVLELESFRCNMEQEIDSIYAFLEKLEVDREEALKRGMLDYIRVAYKINETHDIKKRVEVIQQQIDPASDLQLLLAKHKTGPFVPTVTVFEGYFSPSHVQTYGVDLLHSRFIVPLFLDWLRKQPTDSEAMKLETWINREPIVEIYKLRTQINTGKPFNAETVFKFFTPSVVVSSFLQYLLELPESLVSFLVYEWFKQLYVESPHLEPDVIASVLIQVPQRNREVLEQVITYLTDTFTDKEAFVNLAPALAFTLIRPRAPSSVNMDDVHPQLLMLDLFQHATDIFAAIETKQKDIDTAKQNSTPRISVQQRFGQRQNYTSPLHNCREDNGHTTPSSQSPNMVMSSSRPRPLSLSLQSRYSRSEQSSRKSPSGMESPPTRGLGINLILPLPKSEPRSDFWSSKSSNSSPLMRPRAPVRVISSDELKLPRMRSKEPEEVVPEEVVVSEVTKGIIPHPKLEQTIESTSDNEQ